ncbi:MAG TPA: SGNH/GDSL hydrolase family protein [Planctomycetaceae bacterium]|nr:SGNH/GDSL hydrolase family protein [Planctomycetaceae bacterium]
MGRRSLRAAAGVVLIASLAGVQLPDRMLPNSSVLGKYEWLLLIAAGWSLMWAALVGRPKSIAAWRELIVWNGLFVTVAGLHLFEAVEFVAAWGLMLSLRTAVIVAWTFVVFGWPVVIIGIRRRRRARERRPFLAGRLWFATALTLGLIEPACALWETWRAGALNAQEAARLRLPQALPPPPAGEWHLAAIGESTMLGWPYQPHSSIPQMAAWRLQQREPLAQAEASPCPPIVVRNLAKAGVNLPLAIDELRSLACRPHALLVYCGHNEFYHELDYEAGDRSGPFPQLDGWLARSPTFRVLDRVLESGFPTVWRTTHLGRTLIDLPLLTDDRQAIRLSRFRFRLQQLAEFCRRQQIATIWFVPAASEAGFEPNRSLLRPGSTVDPTALSARYDEAREAERQQDWSRAAAIYRRELVDQRQFAEFHFRLGRCLMELGEYAAAREHLAAALEHDGQPVRMLHSYREAVRDVARDHDIPVIDADAVLRPHTPHNILDRTVFLDDVHPTLKGQFLLAAAVAEPLSEMYAAVCGKAPALRPVTLGEAVATRNVDARALAEAYDRLAAGLDVRSLFRFDVRERREEAERLRAIANRLRSGELAIDSPGVEELDDIDCGQPAH